jgi:cell division protein FtsB
MASTAKGSKIRGQKMLKKIEALKGEFEALTTEKSAIEREIKEKYSYEAYELSAKICADLQTREEQLLELLKSH